MLHKLLPCLALCGMLLASPAFALEEIGAEILGTCLSERRALQGDAAASVRYGLCLGYLKGVADTLDGRAFCIPETGETSLFTQRLKQTYIDYAARHQRALGRHALDTVVPAFQQAFPCR